ncbi:expressed unknown protein [Seminavis robusta]|uniref:DUF4188 domain-containing protein n=1 Tax=Seminavis robusta TaxID=568900 RepID=A0A9N8HYL3_9STRA|nr:expressed unknown protein [Seminavis robusta]|eukprot:Sro2016_g311130.1 n/a (240) ;mRNA; f:3148-3867
MVGLGILLGSLPGLVIHMVMMATTTSISLVLVLLFIPLLLGFGMMFQGTLYPVLYKKLTGSSVDVLTQRVLKGRKAAIRSGDFVVFLIGARANNDFDPYYQWMGDSMAKMWKELEDNPDLGCLSTEYYFGPTGHLTVQYWKSLDDLNRYARNMSNKHAGPWANLMAKGRMSSDYGFWHEAFEVKEGKYDAIYVNMPPIHLGNAIGSSLEDCKGKYTSAAGRAGKTDGSDYAKEIGSPDY